MSSPVTNFAINSDCDGDRWFGWPCDAKTEELRSAYIRARRRRPATRRSRPPPASVGNAARYSSRAVYPALGLALNVTGAASPPDGLLEHRQSLNEAAQESGVGPTVLTEPV
jgi:hypothetical protein